MGDVAAKARFETRLGIGISLFSIGFGNEPRKST